MLDKLVATSLPVRSSYPSLWPRVLRALHYFNRRIPNLLLLGGRDATMLFIGEITMVKVSEIVIKICIAFIARKE